MGTRRNGFSSSILAVVAAATLFALSACTRYGQGARPIDPGLLATEPGWIVAAPTPEIRQRSQLQCGQAALAMVAGRWLVAMTLDDALAVAPPTHDLAVSDLNVAARASGLEAYSVADDPDILEFELRAHRPVIVGLMRRVGGRTLRHYEVVVALRPSTRQVVTIDPAGGWRVRHVEELDAEWSAAGRVALVVVGRTPESQALVPRPKVINTQQTAERHRPEAWPSYYP